MQSQFIKIGRRMFAVQHISVIVLNKGLVEVFVDGDAEPWDFEGEEAKALAAWAKELPCRDLLREHEASHEQTTSA